jgi:hypothetical protein
MTTTRIKTNTTYYVARAKGTRIRHKDEGAVIDVCWGFWHGMGGYSQEAWTDGRLGKSFNNADEAQRIADHYRDSTAESYDFKLIPGTAKVVKVSVETITYTTEEEIV